MDTYRKAKKITVKFFLNQLLEPASNEKGKPLYPLYIQVTYNRKNMQLRSKYGEYYLDLQEVPTALMEFEKTALQKIIAYEAAQQGEGYDIKGLKRKYEVYSLSIHQVVEDYLKPKLRTAILKTNNELIKVLDFGSAHATTALLEEAANRLFPEFKKHVGTRLADELTAYGQFLQLYKLPFLTYSFPMIIDWNDSSYAEEFSKRVNSILKADKEASRSISTLIGHAISEKLTKMEA